MSRFGFLEQRDHHDNEHGREIDNTMDHRSIRQTHMLPRQSDESLEKLDVELMEQSN
jgi:hypothetical protein